MKNFLVRLWDADWQPNHIFYTNIIDGSYTIVRGDIFGGDAFVLRTHNDYTELGQWFEDHAAVLHLVKAPYYLVAWSLFFVLQLVRVVAELFYKPL